MQNLSRSHAWKLIHISHQDQSRPMQDRFQQRLQQKQVHHGHLVHYDHIRLQRVVRIFLKLCAAPAVVVRYTPVQLQQAMYCPRLISGGLRHPFGGSPCGCRQQDVHALLLKIAYHRLDRRRLPGTRSAGQNQYTVPDALHHRLPLQLVQFNFLLFFQFADPSQLTPLFRRQSAFPRLHSTVQVNQHSGAVHLRVVKSGSVHQFFLSFPPAYYFLPLHYNSLTQRWFSESLSPPAGRNAPPPPPPAACKKARSAPGTRNRYESLS